MKCPQFKLTFFNDNESKSQMKGNFSIERPKLFMSGILIDLQLELRPLDEDEETIPLITWTADEFGANISSQTQIQRLLRRHHLYR